MADILLIQPPIRDFYLTRKRTIPYGLACIASALAGEGFSVDILDALATTRSRKIPTPREMDYLQDYYGRPDVSPFALFHHFRHYGLSFDRIGRAARESGAFLVGISSLFSAYSGEALSTAEAVKAAHPDCRIVVGGHHATELPREVLQCEAVDFVLRGEGEASMPALARALRDGTPAESVPGIALRMPEGEIRAGGPAVMENLDRYPLPSFELIDNRFYGRGHGGSAVVIGSRGCPMKCTYCSTGAQSSIPYRRRSVEAVLREIGQAVEIANARFIDFEDENIALEKSWFLELLGGIRERFGHLGLELRAMNGLFPPALNREVIRSMSEAGFRSLNLALGTTSREGLKRFGRVDVRGSVEQALHCAKEYSLEAVGYIIVGAPGQTAEESLRDLLYLAGRRVLAGVSVYYPSPGSTDFERCRTRGILPLHPALMRSTALPISDTTTRDETVTLLRLGRIINFMKALRSGAGQHQEGPPPAGGTGTSEPQRAIIRNRAYDAAGDKTRHEGEAIKDIVCDNSSWSTLTEARSGRPQEERQAIGIRLLELFLQDGRIRGATPDGEIYIHRASRELCSRFIEGIADRGLFSCFKTDSRRQ